MLFRSFSEFQQEPLNALITILAFSIALIVGITVHEFSHAISAYRLGDPTAKNLTSDRAVFYMNDSDVVEFIRPMAPRFNPGQIIENRMKHPGESSTGGTVVYQPNGMVYIDVKAA